MPSASIELEDEPRRAKKRKLADDKQGQPELDEEFHDVIECQEDLGEEFYDVTEYAVDEYPPVDDDDSDFEIPEPRKSKPNVSNLKLNCLQ